MMKKTAAALLAVLIYTGILSYCLPRLLPDWDGILPSIETTVGSDLLLMENKAYCSNLYEVGPEGSIDRVYSKPKADGYSIVDFESVADGRIYCFAQKGSTGVNQITVSRINEAWDGETVIGRLEYESRLLLTSTTVIDDKLYFTALDNMSWKVMLYSCALDAAQDAQLVKEMEWELPENNKIADAAYDGTYLYILDNNGDVGYFLRNSYRYFPQETEGRVLWMEVSSRGLLYATDSRENIWYMKDGISRISSEMSTDGLVDADCIQEGGRTAALCREADYSYVLYREGGSNKTPCNEIRYGIGVLGKLWLGAWLMISILYLLCCSAVFALIHFRGRYHSVTGTMIAGVIGLNTLFVACLTVYIYLNSRHYLEIGRQISNMVYLTMEYFSLQEEVVHLDDVDLDDFPNTEWADLIDQALAGVEVETLDTGALVQFDMDLVYCGEDEDYMLNSRYCVTGRCLHSYYEPQIEQLIHQVRESGEADNGIYELQRHTYVVNVMPYTTEDIFLVSLATMDDLNEKSRITWHSSLKWACIYGAVSMLLIVFVLYRLMLPVKSLTRSMEKVAGGIYVLPEEIFPNNEYGRMWVFLHKMCKALRIQEYARGNVVKYYSRFAPGEFEKLFGKDALQEVSVGDTVSIEGTVGIVSVARREEVLRNGVQGAYIRYINNLLECIGKANERSGGILLANDGSLESAKVIYKEPEMPADTALRFGLDSLRGLREWESADGVTKPLVLLHNGRFSCGLAGMAAQTYPFVASLELELLSNYVEKLKTLDVGFIITGQMQKKLNGKYANRYIGYIAPEPGREFHLYEVLEACKKEERKQKTDAADDFRTGLELYYQNRFQESRSMFLQIIKNCPLDTVAKWYLFACEERLSPDAKPYGETEHGLFQ